MTHSNKTTPCKMVQNMITRLILLPRSVIHYVANNPGKALVLLLSGTSMMSGVSAQDNCDFNFRSVAENTMFGGITGLGVGGVRGGVPGAMGHAIYGAASAAVIGTNNELNRVNDCNFNQMVNPSRQPVHMTNDEIQQNSYNAEQYHPEHRIG